MAVGGMAAAPGGLGSQPRAKGATAGTADPFDLWLGHTLRQAFGAIAKEPVPEELLRLAEGGRAGRDDGASSN